MRESIPLSPHDDPFAGFNKEKPKINRRTCGKCGKEFTSETAIERSASQEMLVCPHCGAEWIDQEKGKQEREM